MISVSVNHGDTTVTIDSDDEAYLPDVIDDMCKHATRACYAAHVWISGVQVQPDP